jgi:hypothetical protein
VQLLQSNISGLADTLSEIDGLSQLPSVNSTSAAHASEGMSLPVPQAIGFSLEAARPVISTDGPQQHNVAQSGRVPATPLSAAALLQQPIGQGDISASLLSTTATPTMEAASLHQLQRLPFVHPLHPLYPGTPQPAVDTSGTKTSMPSDRPDTALDVDVSVSSLDSVAPEALYHLKGSILIEACIFGYAPRKPHACFGRLLESLVAMGLTAAAPFLHSVMQQRRQHSKQRRHGEHD